MFTNARSATLLAAALLAMSSVACQRAYYGAWDRLGYEKRDILVSRVEKARDAQHDAKEQFRSALEEFQAVVGVPESELEDKYHELESELESSEAQAAAVHERIASVESVGDALFEEWASELDRYESAELRSSSRRKMVETRGRYDELLAAMRRAEARIDPVVGAFRDQVLFLKHNLNARAVAALRTELAEVEAETAALIRAMEASIAEADAFVRTMGE